MADHSTESRICSGVTTAPADPATQGGGRGSGATCWSNLRPKGSEIQRTIPILYAPDCNPINRIISLKHESSRLLKILLVISSEMTRKTGQMCIRASVRCQYFQNSSWLWDRLAEVDETWHVLVCSNGLETKRLVKAEFWIAAPAPCGRDDHPEWGDFVSDEILKYSHLYQKLICCRSHVSQMG